ITQAELLVNASDVDGPSLTATGLAISTGLGSLVDNGDGTWTYTSALNDDSAVAFSYTITAGTDTVAGSASLDITPVNDAPAGLPTINGTVTEDQTLTANTTGISDDDGLGAFNYQWLRDGVLVGGANASTYVLGDADVGTQISVRVSYTDAQGTAESVTSVQTTPVVNVNDAPSGLPTINGTVTEDQTLTANTAGISDDDGLGAFSFQWLRNGGVIGGATASTYELGDTDVGTQISVRVSYTDAQSTAESVMSVQTVPVANLNDAPAGVPTISGTVSEDQTLTVNASGISDDDGLGAFSYQWLRNGAVIGGATASTYALGDTDVGTQISVRVSYTDAQGMAEGPLTSAQTVPVTNINDAPVLARPIADQAVVHGASLRFQIPNATFVDADAGDTLRYVATQLDGSSLPAWLSFDDGLLTFTGTPGASEIGQTLVRVIATDPSGAAAQAVFAITVRVPTTTTLPPVAQVVAPTLPAPDEPPVQAQTEPESSTEAVTAAPLVPPVPAPLLETTQSTVLSLGVVTPASGRDIATEAPATTTRPESRADAVLANAITPSFSDTRLGALSRLLQSDELMRRFEELQRQMLEQSEDRRITLASSLALTSGVSIGYVVWLVRGGVLLSSMLSALPAWQMIDPLPVLAAAKGKRKEIDPYDAEVERLFNAPSDDQRAATPAQVTEAAPHEDPISKENR
ncbi:MAG: cadherin-like domain-containing protein, partial [Burkholderiaceae bacterium]|nr:cadherin-like domain-containing protein [Burkholderiaceae bacterium]